MVGSVPEVWCMWGGYALKWELVLQLTCMSHSVLNVRVYSSFLTVPYVIKDRFCLVFITSYTGGKFM